MPERVQPISASMTASSIRALQMYSFRSEGGGPFQDYLVAQPRAEKVIEEQLFDALAEAKIWTSRVAMHLDSETRKRLFRQLDVLHNAEDWDQRDKTVNLESYQSLVRAIIHHSIDCRPSLALMPSGNLLAQWRDGNDKLTVEFVPGNRLRWLVQSHTEEGPERASGTSPLERLRTVLAPYGAERWFDGR